VAQERLLSMGVGIAEPVPVPVSDTVAVLLVDELLVMLTVPPAKPVAVGSKVTLKTTPTLGTTVTGSVRPETLYPAPWTLIADTTSGAVPVDWMATFCDRRELTATLPNQTAFLPRVSTGVLAGTVTGADWPRTESEVAEKVSSAQSRAKREPWLDFELRLDVEATSGFDSEEVERMIADTIHILRAFSCADLVAKVASALMCESAKP
jgi:hypothetical protein